MTDPQFTECAVASRESFRQQLQNATAFFSPSLNLKRTYDIDRSRIWGRELRVQYPHDDGKNCLFLIGHSLNDLFYEKTINKLTNWWIATLKAKCCCCSTLEARANCQCKEKWRDKAGGLHSTDPERSERPIFSQWVSQSSALQIHWSNLKETVTNVL